MSYDIHGNPLARGHCEVHPYVAQPYPCTLCYREQEDSAEQGRLHDAMASTINERDIFEKDMRQARGDAADWREKYERASATCADLSHALAGIAEYADKGQPMRPGALVMQEARSALARAKNQRRDNLRAQEVVVSAIWEFAELNGESGRGAKITNARGVKADEYAIGHALEKIMGAFGFEVTEIQ